jgi:predicted HTH transcriptional regulator
MNIESIKIMAHELLEQRHIENDYIEYKKSDTFKDKILKTVCAFANNYMNREIGLLFIGVEEVDDKETGAKAVPVRPISGIDMDKIEAVESRLKNLLSNIHPKPNYHLISDVIDEKYYIILAVEPGSNGPFITSEKAESDKNINLKPARYIRISRDTVAPNVMQEFELLKKFAGYTFSSSLHETATLDDLNYEYMREYLIATGAGKDIRELSKRDMAKSMGLISESEFGGIRAKNFAVLMFADRPEAFIKGAHVEIIRETEDGTDKMESKIFDGPIWIQAKQVSKYFEDNIMASYTVRKNDIIEHKIIYNWPLSAFEELATNCILHKEYSEPYYVGIYVYPDRITFINHNRPVPPVTIEDLNKKTSFDDRKYINPEIKDMFFSLHLIESYGSGVRRAKIALQQNGSKPVEYLPDNDTDNYTNAIIYINEEYKTIHDKEVGKTNQGIHNDAPNDVPNDAPKLTVRQRKILEMIRNSNNISKEKMALELDKSVTTIQRDLRRLRNEGYISYENQGSGVVWTILK